jgi:hypothetical protein
LRERWFGATGRRVPQLTVEGELDLDSALVLDELDLEQIGQAWDEGRPVVVRADSEEAVLEALRRPEVSSVIVPPHLVDLDVVKLTYG